MASNTGNDCIHGNGPNRRYELPMPPPALLVIGWIENGSVSVNAFCGTVSVSRPSGLASVPPAGPISLTYLVPFGRADFRRSKYRLSIAGFARKQAAAKSADDQEKERDQNLMVSLVSHF